MQNGHKLLQNADRSKVNCNNKQHILSLSVSARYLLSNACKKRSWSDCWRIVCWTWPFPAVVLGPSTPSRSLRFGGIFTQSWNTIWMWQKHTAQLNTKASQPNQSRGYSGMENPTKKRTKPLRWVMCEMDRGWSGAVSGGQPGLLGVWATPREPNQIHENNETQTKSTANRNTFTFFTLRHSFHHHNHKSSAPKTKLKCCWQLLCIQLWWLMLLHVAHSAKRSTILYL